MGMPFTYENQQSWSGEEDDWIKQEDSPAFQRQMLHNEIEKRKEQIRELEEDLKILEMEVS